MPRHFPDEMAEAKKYNKMTCFGNFFPFLIIFRVFLLLQLIEDFEKIYNRKLIYLYMFIYQAHIIINCLFDVDTNQIHLLTHYMQNK